MLISKPRMTFMTRHTSDGEVLIKITDVQIITAYTVPHNKDVSDKWESEIDTLVSKAMDTERVRIHCIMIGDFIFNGNPDSKDEEIRKRIEELTMRQR